MLSFVLRNLLVSDLLEYLICKLTPMTPIKQTNATWNSLQIYCFSLVKWKLSWPLIGWRLSEKIVSKHETLAALSGITLHFIVFKCWRFLHEKKSFIWFDVLTEAFCIVLFLVINWSHFLSESLSGFIKFLPKYRPRHRHLLVLMMSNALNIIIGIFTAHVGI